MPSSVDSSLDDSSSVASYDSDEEYRLAQQEWEESLEQLKQLVAIVLLPFFGKWLGRRWSHIGTLPSNSDYSSISTTSHYQPMSAICAWVWAEPSFSGKDPSQDDCLKIGADN